MDETPNKALEAVVTAMGGSKVVAPLLWPEKGVDEARRLLCDCLNDDRPAKLDFAQVLFILKMARRRGIHTGIEYISGHLGYSVPTPIDPEDERAALQREFIEHVKRMERLSAQLGLAPHLRPAA